MNKVTNYINRRYKKENRYWTFERVCEYLPHNSMAFACPQCGELNYRSVWDDTDEILPRCLLCHELVVEDENED